jgi:hypothetical protein
MVNIQLLFALLRIHSRDSSLAAFAPRSVERTFLRILGAGLLVFGALGFVPRLVPGGHLLGVFAVDAPHNVLHLLTGGAALAVARMPKRVHVWSGTAVLSIAYGLLTIFGFAQRGTLLGLMRSNAADNLLHLFIAVIALGVVVLTEYGSMLPSAAALKILLGIHSKPNKSDMPPSAPCRNATA